MKNSVVTASRAQIVEALESLSPVDRLYDEYGGWERRCPLSVAIGDRPEGMSDQDFAYPDGRVAARLIGWPVDVCDEILLAYTIAQEAGEEHEESFRLGVGAGLECVDGLSVRYLP